MTAVLYLLLFMLTFALIIVSLLYVREGNRSKYYLEILNKVLANEDMIQESLATVAEAYGVEEGDILEFISSKRKDKK